MILMWMRDLFQSGSRRWSFSIRCTYRIPNQKENRLIWFISFSFFIADILILIYENLEFILNSCIKKQDDPVQILVKCPSSKCPSSLQDGKHLAKPLQCNTLSMSAPKGKDRLQLNRFWVVITIFPYQEDR